MAPRLFDDEDDQIDYYRYESMWTMIVITMLVVISLTVTALVCGCCGEKRTYGKSTHTRSAIPDMPSLENSNPTGSIDQSDGSDETRVVVVVEQKPKKKKKRTVKSKESGSSGETRKKQAKAKKVEKVKMKKKQKLRSKSKSRESGDDKPNVKKTVQSKKKTIAARLALSKPIVTPNAETKQRAIGESAAPPAAQSARHYYDPETMQAARPTKQQAMMPVRQSDAPHYRTFFQVQPDDFDPSKRSSGGQHGGQHDGGQEVGGFYPQWGQQTAPVALDAALMPPPMMATTTSTNPKKPKKPKKEVSLSRFISS